MKFLLDTSTCIEHLRGRSPALTERLGAETGNVALCSIVVAELVYGALRSSGSKVELAKAARFISGFPSLAFDDAAAEHAAKLRATLAAADTPIGPYDLLIAAIAVEHGLTLVSSNTGEFARVPDLVLADWRSA